MYWSRHWERCCIGKSWIVLLPRGYAEEEGRAERAVITRIGKGWGKFRALAPLMCTKSTPMALRGKLYSACVRSCMVYGSETWALTVENQRRLERAERQMLKRICGGTLKERISSEELRQRLDVEGVMDVIRRGRLRWYGHVMRKQDEDWVKKCISMEVDGKKPRGRPKLTWMDTVKSDMDRTDLTPVFAHDRNVWRRWTSRRRQENL